MLVSNKRYSLKHDGICANTFTFPKWGKGDRRAGFPETRLRVFGVRAWRGG